jgi:hypothetical protein
LLSAFADQMLDSFGAVLPLFYEMSSFDMSREVANRFFVMEVQGFTTRDTEDITMPDKAMELAGGALMTLCDALSQQPALLEEWAPRIADRISQLTDSIIPFTHHSIAHAIIFLSAGLKKLNARPPELIDCFSVALRRLMDETREVQTFDWSLSAFAQLVRDLGIDCLAAHLPAVVDILQSGLQGLLPCLEGGAFSLDLRGSFSEAIDAIVTADHALFAPLLPHVLALAQGRDADLKEFAVSVLADYAAAARPVPPDFVHALFELALDVCAGPERSEGFVAIATLARAAPELAREFVPAIVQRISERISVARRPKSDGRIRALECAIACLGTVVIDLIGDGFPVGDYVGRVLPWIPAEFDSTQNEQLMTFFLWIANRPGALQQWGAELCGVLVRLFAQSPAHLAKCGIEEERLQELRAIFARIVRMIPRGEDVCVRFCRGRQAGLKFVRDALARAG